MRQSEYELARNESDEEAANNPYRVTYVPERDRDGDFQLVEGTYHTEWGTVLSASEILGDEKWERVLRRADCEWLRPLLRRIAAGEDVSTAEILAARDEHREDT